MEVNKRMMIDACRVDGVCGGLSAWPNHHNRCCIGSSLGQVSASWVRSRTKKKRRTPTMGGIMMLIAVLVASGVFGHEGVEFLLPTLLG